MPRPPDHVRRAELLSGVIGYLGEYGLTELSLRPLAAYLGTSSRMLIHYFGTKEQMLIAALETQRPDIAGMFADIPDLATLRTVMSESFCVNTTADWISSTRVLLQVLGVASIPDSPFRGYAEDAVHVLVEALTTTLSRFHPTVADPESTATVLVSGIRGLLQDRLVTGDDDRVDRAARMLIDRMLTPGPSADR